MSQRKQTDTALAALLTSPPPSDGQRLLTRLNILHADAKPWPAVQATIQEAMNLLQRETGLEAPDSVPNVSVADLRRMLEMVKAKPS